MVALKLVTCGDRVRPIDALRQFADRADRLTLLSIAQLLVNYAPPPWLRAAVDNNVVIHEYIPSEDATALAWIGEDLDALLLRAHSSLHALDRDAFRSRFGTAAELMVLAAKTRIGAEPIHVARLSDSYGYDIECRRGPVERIEVKAASVRTQDSFYLTRNEYEKSQAFRQEWYLVQVVFSNAAFTSSCLDASHVEAVRRLGPEAIEKLVPPDTPTFRWAESAQVSPPIEAWETANIALDPDVRIDGF